MKKFFGLAVLLLTLTSCSTSEKTVGVPTVANVEGLWKSSLVTTEACGERYINDTTEIVFEFSQQGTFLTAPVTARSEVVGGTSIHAGTFTGSVTPNGGVNGVWIVEQAPAGDVPAPPYNIEIALQLSGTTLAGTTLHKGGAYCLGGKWEDARGTMVLEKQAF